MNRKSQQYGFIGRLRSLFNGQSTLSSLNSSRSVPSLKSPAPRIGLSVLSSPVVPDLSSRFGREAALSSYPTDENITEAPSTARSPQFRLPIEPSTPRISRARRMSPRNDWDLEVGRHASGDSQTRRRRKRNGGRPRGATKKIFRERAGRVKLIRCVALGSLLLISLAIYLALALNGIVTGLQLNVSIIVIGLILVMAFAHSAVRLGMYIFRPPQYPTAGSSSNPIVTPHEPIPVVFRRDEEEMIDGDENDDDDNDDDEYGVPKGALIPAPPPAYGLWRGSTRMDPKLLYWQKVRDVQRAASLSERIVSHSEQTNSSIRPPSYASENGV